MNGIFGIGIAELFFIAIIALVVLGPERLPSTMREIAKYIRMARDLSGELTSQFSEELKALDEINPQKIMKEFLDDPKETAKPTKSPPNKTTTGKSAPKKPAVKKPLAESGTATAAKATAATAAAAEAVAVESSLPTEEAMAADGASAANPETDSAPSEFSAHSKDESARDEQVNLEAPNAADSQTSTSVDEQVEEYSIAPAELAANLEQEDADATIVSSEAASLSVNGTHDSVEDRA